MKATDPQRAATWVFDLDNTLYPYSCRLFEQVRALIGAYVAQYLGLPEDEARVEQRRMFRAHGTTLRGMMIEHGADPNAYLAFVEDIDYGRLSARPDLGAVLARLPGRKVVFTNASARHAVARLHIADAFDGVFDTVAADFVPKPALATYHAMLAAFDIAPETAVMVEDMAVNLKPAAALGMTTVWLRNDFDFAKPEPGSSYVDHEVDDLVTWLREVADGRM